MVKIVMLRKQGPQKRTQESVGLEGPGAELFGVKQKAF